MTRFTGCAEPRLLGGVRNVFRRTWERSLVLADMSDAAGANGQHLGEDELVNAFERSRLVRSHDLARALAANTLSANVSSQSDYARKTTKYVKRNLGAFSVDALTAENLTKLVTTAGLRVAKS